MASALETVRKAIDDLIIAGWVDDNSNEKTPIAWPNDMLTPPHDDAYIGIDYLWGDAFMTTKNGRNTLIGVLSADIYVPPQDGTGEIYSLADTFRDILNRASATNIEFSAASGPRIVPNEDGSHIRANISIPFQVQDT